MVEQGGLGTEVHQRSRDKAAVGALPPEAIGTIKYCAYKTGFCASSVCICYC